MAKHCDPRKILKQISDPTVGGTGSNPPRSPAARTAVRDDADVAVT